MKNRHIAFDRFRRTARALDFHDVREWLASFCRTTVGTLACREMVPADERETAALLLDETGEMLELMDAGEPLFPQTVEDPDGVLTSVGRGVLPAEKDIKAIFSFLDQSDRLRDFLGTGIAPESRLGALCLGYADLAALSRFVRATFGGTGRIRTDANAKLMQLDAQINTLRRRINEKAESMSMRRDVAEKLQDTYVTIRNDRVVLPIKIEYKNAFPGIIHGISATDKTAFMEPQELVKENNLLREAMSERDEEVYLLYRQTAQRLKDDEREIRENYRILGALDAVCARARFSALVGGTRPSFAGDGAILMKELRHPLMVARKENPRPNTLAMDPAQKTLVVSGPNAGGKTVMLKGVALTVALASCGVFPSVAEGSSFPFARRLFAVAGDEQSLEEGQSTFSASLHGIKEAIAEAGEGTWVLVDEILNGTDPTQATALAETVLEFLGEKGCRVFVSTHLPGLKVMAQGNPAVVNAAMGVGEDGATTFKLTIGHPGVSFPLGIAQTVGIPDDIIHRAKEKLSSVEDRYQSALQDLQVKADRLDAAVTDYEKKIRETDRLNDELARKEAVATAQREAFEREKNRRLKREIARMRDEIAQMMEQARAGDNRQKKEIRAHLGAMADALVVKTKQPDTVPLEKVKEGEPVWIVSLDRRAELLKRCEEGKVELLSGGVRITLPASDVLGLKAGTEEPRTTRKSRPVAVERECEVELSLLGLTGEEAIAKLEKFLDDHMVAGSESVRVIHGKGVLKGKVIGYLDVSRYVASHRPSELSRGGDGATEVLLRG